MGKERTTYSIKRKLEIIRIIEVDKKPIDVVARELKINKRCLQRWTIQKPSLMKAAQSKQGGARRYLVNKNSAKPRFPALEKVAKWIRKSRQKGE
mgnify:CR=1 FL=1